MGVRAGHRVRVRGNRDKVPPGGFQLSVKPIKTKLVILVLTQLTLTQLRTEPSVYSLLSETDAVS